MQNYLHTVVEEMICDCKRRLKFHITYESRKLVVYVMGQLKVFFLRQSVGLWLLLEPVQQLCCQEMNDEMVRTNNPDD